jgi:hypothetical protein
MKIAKPRPPVGEAGYFFVTLNLMVGIVLLMAVISIGVMFYGGLQFIGH